MRKANGFLAWVMMLGLLVTGSGLSRATAEESPRELLDRAVKQIPESPFRAEMTLYSSGLERQMILYHGRIDETTYGSRLEVTAPHDVKDTRFLFIEKTEGRDEQFIFMPMVGRTIQVSEKTREQPFLGSEFYVSDLVAPDADAFEMKYVGAEERLGRQCKIVEAVPKNPDDWMYSKAVYSIDPADLLILRSEFYDKKGKLLKVWTLVKVEKVEGQWTPYVQTMENVQQNGLSKLELTDIKYNVELPDGVFERGNLGR